MKYLLFLTVALFVASSSAFVEAQTCETYRVVPQTVYEQRPVTTMRLETETVIEQCPIVVRRPVWETQMRERRYTVLKPVRETSTREERYSVLRPVYETAEREEVVVPPDPLDAEQLAEHRRDPRLHRALRHHGAKALSP